MIFCRGKAAFPRLNLPFYESYSDNFLPILTATWNSIFPSCVRRPLSSTTWNHATWRVLFASITAFFTASEELSLETPTISMISNVFDIILLPVRLLKIVQVTIRSGKFGINSKIFSLEGIIIKNCSTDKEKQLNLFDSIDYKA